MSVITETAALAELCQHLERQDYITVDTEFLRDATFWPRLCLVQLGADDGAWAIDPLAGDMDLAPLWALLVEAPLPKVFHAARQDVEIIVRATRRVRRALRRLRTRVASIGFSSCFLLG